MNNTREVCQQRNLPGFGKKTQKYGEQSAQGSVDKFEALDLTVEAFREAIHRFDGDVDVVRFIREASRCKTFRSNANLRSAMCHRVLEVWIDFQIVKRIRDEVLCN
jgi:hypothetical protein